MTSIPSFTRNGLPSFSFSSSAPSGSTSTAFLVSSATDMRRHYTPRILRFRRRRESPAPKKGRRIRKRRLLILTFALFILALSSFTFGLVTAIAGEIPKLDPSRQHHQENTKIYDSTGKRVLAVLRGSENRVLVDYSDISPVMKQAIVSVEDRRFFEHRGVDVRAIGRAVWQDVTQKGVVQGGSTITQQFIKNTYVRNQRSIGRKLREAALAWQLEQQWSKKKILTAYLNTIYFGNGAYGVDQASLTYFGHHAKRLTLAESALLAGLPADPSRYDPVTNPKAARLSAQGRPADDARPGLDHLRAVPGGEQVPAPPRRAGAGHPRARRLLHELRDPAARRQVPGQGRLRRRPPGEDDARPGAPEDRAPRDRALAEERGRAGRGARRRRPAQRARSRR